MPSSIDSDLQLEIISKFGSIGKEEMIWEKLQPNEKGDWLNHRNDIFETFIPLAPIKKFDSKEKTVFITYSNGIVTSRDSWVYNYSRSELELTIKPMIDFYNAEYETYKRAIALNPKLEVENSIDNNPKKISWSRSLKSDIKRGRTHTFKADKIITSVNRPFCKQSLYFDTPFIESPSINSKLFPYTGSENKIIAVTGIGASKAFSSLMLDHITDFQSLMNCICFPLYYYEEKLKQTKTLFDTSASDSEYEYIKRDGVSDFILDQARKIYGLKVSKEDIFYYVYGVLYSSDYCQRFENDLKKMLPRIPLVDEPKDFWSFSKSGRKLAELHLDYEAAPRPEVVTVDGEESNFFNVRL